MSSLILQLEGSAGVNFRGAALSGALVKAVEDTVLLAEAFEEVPVIFAVRLDLSPLIVRNAENTALNHTRHPKMQNRTESHPE